MKSRQDLPMDETRDVRTRGTKEDPKARGLGGWWGMGGGGPQEEATATPQEPGPSADGLAKFLRKAINLDVSVKCLNFQTLAAYSKMLKTLQGQENRWTGSSLVVQWLRLGSFYCKGRDLVPGWGTKIPHATQPKIHK